MHKDGQTHGEKLSFITTDELYYAKFAMENLVCSFYNSCTETRKKIPSQYDLLETIPLRHIYLNCSFINNISSCENIKQSE